MCLCVGGESIVSTTPGEQMKLGDAEYSRTQVMRSEEMRVDNASDDVAGNAYEALPLDSMATC